MIDVKALTAALVELEEEKINWDCISDQCDHDECPEPPGIGCGDAARLAELYEAAVKA